MSKSGSSPFALFRTAFGNRGLDAHGIGLISSDADCWVPGSIAKWHMGYLPTLSDQSSSDHALIHSPVGAWTGMEKRSMQHPTTLSRWTGIGTWAGKGYGNVVWYFSAGVWDLGELGRLS